jgi:putative acetyltransferase
MQITIRPATESDAPAACNVLRRSIRELCVDDHGSDEEILRLWLANKTEENLRRWIVSNANFAVVALRQKAICGFGMLHQSGEVQLCYVAPEARFAGVSKLILQALEEQGRRWRLPNLFLTSTTVARPFYQRRGWIVSGEPIPMFGMKTIYPMHKILTKVGIVKNGSMIAIRLERSEDAEAVRQVNRATFGRGNEADLVDRLRADSQVVLSLVAESSLRIVGHCLFSPVTLEPRNHELCLAGLGPMAVLPECQRQGIGSRLVRQGLDHFRSAGYEGVVVLGHPDYYPRFGFVPASRYGLRCEFPVPDEAFMALALREEVFSRSPVTVKYHTAFDAV